MMFDENRPDFPFEIMSAELADNRVVRMSFNHPNGSEKEHYDVFLETFADFLTRAKEGEFDHLAPEPVDPEFLLQSLVTDMAEDNDATPRDPLALSECAWCHGKPLPHDAVCPWKMAVDHVKRMGDEPY